MMDYREILPISRHDAETAFSGGSIEDICDALIRLTYHDPDWKWVQSQCLRFGKHPSSEVRGLAVTCLGHLARIHGTLDMESARPLLEELLEDPEISGRVEDAMDDIRVFIKK